ncbi:MAG: ATP-grasp domain-containing protein [Clostridium sp.]|uniref:ATP-grasp domain-containing protein n=1 Tax=Clostridium sp. TaxID=1506 RepID=UPI003D6CF601
MNVTRIWFNRWFSSAYNIIDLIKNNEDGRKFEIFVSHSNEHSITLQNADYAFIEPNLSDNDYIEYCLDFCTKHAINIFVPYHQLMLISNNIDRFEKINIKVLASNNIDLLNLIDDKVLFYNDIKSKNILKIPEYSVVNTKESFIVAYNKLKLIGRVCFKPTDGVGGAGFRIIKESKTTIEDILNGFPSYSIYLDDILDLLPEECSFQNIMLMEYLDEYEYSIDCLADKNGNLVRAIPRKKIDKYNRYLENNEDLIRIAHKVSESYKIPFIYNIQVIYKNEEPNLLEINTRMAGGVHYTCMSGVNLPYEAIKVLMDESISTSDVNLDIMVGNIETSIICDSINNVNV